MDVALFFRRIGHSVADAYWKSFPMCILSASILTSFEGLVAV